MDIFLASPYAMGLVALSVNLGTTFLVQEMHHFMEPVFKYRISRYVIMFFVLLLSTRSLYFSALFSLGMYVLVVYLCDENSPVGFLARKRRRAIADWKTSFLWPKRDSKPETSSAPPNSLLPPNAHLPQALGPVTQFPSEPAAEGEFQPLPISVAF